MAIVDEIADGLTSNWRSIQQSQRESERLGMAQEKLGMEKEAHDVGMQAKQMKLEIMSREAQEYQIEEDRRNVERDVKVSEAKQKQSVLNYNKKNGPYAYESERAASASASKLANAKEELTHEYDNKIRLEQEKARGAKDIAGMKKIATGLKNERMDKEKRLELDSALDNLNSLEEDIGIVNQAIKNKVYFGKVHVLPGASTIHAASSDDYGRALASLKRIQTSRKIQMIGEAGGVRAFDSEKEMKSLYESLANEEMESDVLADALTKLTAQIDSSRNNYGRIYPDTKGSFEGMKKEKEDKKSRVFDNKAKTRLEELRAKREGK